MAETATDRVGGWLNPRDWPYQRACGQCGRTMGSSVPWPPRVDGVADPVCLKCHPGKTWAKEIEKVVEATVKGESVTLAAWWQIYRRMMEIPERREAGWMTMVMEREAEIAFGYGTMMALTLLWPLVKQRAKAGQDTYMDTYMETMRDTMAAMMNEAMAWYERRQLDQ